MGNLISDEIQIFEFEAFTEKAGHFRMLIYPLLVDRAETTRHGSSGPRNQG